MVKTSLKKQSKFFDTREQLLLDFKKFAERGELYKVPTSLLKNLPTDLRVLYEKSWRKQSKVKWIMFKTALLRAYQEQYDVRVKDN